MAASRAIRAVLFILLALVAGNDFLLEPVFSLDQDGLAAKHRPSALILNANADDGDEHLVPMPEGGGLGGALLVVLALVLCGPRAVQTIRPPSGLGPRVAAHVHVAEPRGPPVPLASA